MSSFATTWAWNQRAGRAKAVLLALVEFADAEGVCRVPQLHLAAMTEHSESTVRRHLVELEERGLIQRSEVKAPDGSQMLDEIRLSGCRRRLDPRPEKPAVQGGVNLTGGSEKPAEMGGVNLTAITYKNNSIYTSSSTNNTPPSSTAMTSNVTETDVGAEPAKSETLNSNLTPDGEASDEAQEAAPVQTDFKNMLQDGGNVNVTGSEGLPPPAAAPFRASMAAIEAAGLTPVWVQWIKLNRLQQVTQEAQIQIWRGWIDAGLSDVLKTEASDIVESGSFSHPWGGLRARMRKAEAAKATQVQVVAVFGAPRVQPGERRTAPDGQTWTVEIVEYGIVYFEEIGAPTDQPDAAVGRWPLEAARG